MRGGDGGSAELWVGGSCRLTRSFSHPSTPTGLFLHCSDDLHFHPVSFHLPRLPADEELSLSFCATSALPPPLTHYIGAPPQAGAGAGGRGFDYALQRNHGGRRSRGVSGPPSADGGRRERGCYHGGRREFDCVLIPPRLRGEANILSCSRLCPRFLRGSRTHSRARARMPRCGCWGRRCAALSWRPASNA